MLTDVIEFACVLAPQSHAPAHHWSITRNTSIDVYTNANSACTWGGDHDASAILMLGQARQGQARQEAGVAGALVQGVRVEETAATCGHIEEREGIAARVFTARSREPHRPTPSVLLCGCVGVWVGVVVQAVWLCVTTCVSV